MSRRANYFRLPLLLSISVVELIILGCAIPGGTTSGAPPTPTGLSVGSPTATSLTVSWNSSDGADGYICYRDASPSGSFSTQVYNGPSTAYADIGLIPGTTYYYKCLAKNQNGTSALSGAVPGTTLGSGASAPATPTGLTVGSATSSSFVVSWTVSSGAISYQVYRDTSSTGTFTTVAYNGSSTSFTDANLTSSTTYYYKVQATNVTGSSALSGAVSGRTLAGGNAPTTPTGLTVGSATSSSLVVSWTTSSGAISYQVYRDTSSTGTFTTVAYNGSSTSFTDANLTSSATYYYKVQATNVTGSSALSGAQWGTTLAAIWGVSNGFESFKTSDPGNCGSYLYYTIPGSSLILTSSSPSVTTGLELLAGQISGYAGGPGSIAGYGVLFSYTDPNNFFIFLLSTNGYYEVLQKQNGNWNTLLPWTSSSDILQGDQLNQIDVAYIHYSDGNYYLVFYINTMYENLLQITNTTLNAGGLTGFVVGIGSSNQESFPGTPVTAGFEQTVPVNYPASSKALSPAEGKALPLPTELEARR